MKKHTSLLARLGLVLAAIIWGSAFVVMKNTVDVFPPFLLLFFRFAAGCLVLALIFIKRLRHITGPLFLRGCLLGLLLGIAYSVQTIGLMDTTPGKNAFLTTVYCVLVPFLAYVIFRRKPDKFNWIAAVLCMAGVGLVSLTGDLTIGRGDLLTLISGIFYALHIVCVDRFASKDDPVLLTIGQFFSAAIGCGMVSLCTESMPVAIPADAWLGLGYLAVFSTALALLLQNVGQKYVPPAGASILLSLESVFGVFFSVLYYGETVTPRLALGFLLIFCAVVISETKCSFLKRNKTQEGLNHGMEHA